MAVEKYSQYHLVYFDVRALAEPIRMIFAYSGTPYKDERLPWDYPNWFNNLKKNYDESVGQIPILHVGDKMLTNSQVISRYLAKKFGLVGDNDWDEARVNELIAMVHDLFILWRNITNETDPQRKILMRNTQLNPKFPLYYAKWSKILEEKPGPFLLGNKLTHADFWLANFISIWDNPLSGDMPVIPPEIPLHVESDLYVGLTKNYPALRKHLEAVENIPQIKEWIAKRHKTAN